MSKSVEETDIRDAINRYVDGTRAGNVETLKEGFHAQAILCGYLGDHLITAPIRGYYDWVAENPAPVVTGIPFECEVQSIEVTGRVATATVRETSHGEIVIDYFHLLKVDGRWWVVSKLWDAESKWRSIGDHGSSQHLHRMRRVMNFYRVRPMTGRWSTGAIDAPGWC